MSCHLVDLFDTYAFYLRYLLGDIPHVGALVALAPMWNGCHIGAVGFKNDTLQRHHLWQDFGQMAFLECAYATYSEHKTIKLKQLFGFNGIAGEAVKHAARKSVGILTQDFHHLVLCLSTVNHQRKAGFNGPLYLLAESIQLLGLKLTAPIEVQTNLADGNVGPMVGLLHESFVQLLELRLIVGSNIFGVQTYHGIKSVGILLADAFNLLNVVQADGWHQDAVNAGLCSARNDIGKVGKIAGSQMLDGKLVSTARYRILRGGEKVWEGKLQTLRHFKDEVKEVTGQQECGICFANYEDFAEGDVVEVLDVYQICDPYLERSEVTLSPLLMPCQQVWQRMADKEPQDIHALAEELKEYFLCVKS